MHALILLLACTGDPAPGDSPTTPPADSPVDSPTDTQGDSSGQDTPGDTASPYGLDARPENVGCALPERPASGASVALTPAFPALRFAEPVQLLQAPGDASRWFVPELYAGQIRVFDDDPAVASYQTWLDLSDRVYAASLETGLLSVAFHPDWPATPHLYVSYTAREGGQTVSRVSRFTTPDGGVNVDPASETVVLSIDQPWDNHNGSHLLFGPDGYLYASFGDGGSAGDPDGHAQDTSTLLGTILRIDVDAGEPYGIPDDNPFASGGAAPGQGAAEIYAWGLRNVWRFSFDRETGDLWAGDVGQNAREEVDRVQSGGNYGWNVLEGTLCYRSATCDEGGLIPPVVEYAHPAGQVSVVGGYVYRGSEIPDLVGSYLFADFYTGDLYAVIYDPLTGEPSPQVLLGAPGLYMGSFTETSDGEIYVVDTGGGGLFRLEAAGAPTKDTFPDALSETGCFDPADPSSFADALIPYGVNVPFWSDGADKERGFALPEGAVIDVSGDSWVLPVGSVVAKTFHFEGAPVETRLLVRHDDGYWAGYSYEWDGDDAILLPSSKQKTIGEAEWYYPSRAECLGCHTAEADYTLGLDTRQLNGEWTYPNGRTAHQLETLSHIEVLSAPLDGTASRLPPLSELDTEGQARAWLDVNCAYCHLPDGAGPGDMRYSTALAETGLCAAPEHGDLGVDGALIVTPGAPERSVLYLRATAEDANRMPPAGGLTVDPEGAAALSTWITGLGECPEGK